MKTIVAGSRDITDYDIVARAIESCGWTITEVVSGAAPGVDLSGEIWATVNSIPIKQFPAQWSRFGRSAGPMRNIEMANYAEALIAVTNGSKGTAHMIRMAKERGLKIHIWEVNAPEEREPIQPGDYRYYKAH